MNNLEIFWQTEHFEFFFYFIKFKRQNQFLKYKIHTKFSKKT